MSNVGKTRVAGHALIAEGWPFYENGTRAVCRSATGYAMCECGAKSDPTMFNIVRKR